MIFSYSLLEISEDINKILLISNITAKILEHGCKFRIC